MAKLSKEIEGGFLKEDVECSICYEKAKRGAFWHIGPSERFIVCDNCKFTLMELLIDALEDDPNIEILDPKGKLEILKSISTITLLRKEGIKKILKNKL